MRPLVSLDICRFDRNRRMKGSTALDANCRSTPAPTGSVPGVKDLLPYLAGAASAFVVQFLIQVYVAPLVETRKRRLERWEKDVLDLGDLLSGTVRDAARQSEHEQFAWRAAEKMVGNPDYNPTTVDGYRADSLHAAREATRNFRDLVDLRAEWLMDRISVYRSSDQVSKFTLGHMRYQLHLMTYSYDGWRELADEDWEAWWAEHNRLLAGLILDLRRLATDRHPLRISWRARLRHARYRTKRRLAKIRRKPLESPPAVQAEQEEQLKASAS
jgi:hypothetical protein